MGDGPISAVKLLIVDDEPDLETLLLFAFRSQIRHLGWQLHFAGNGAEALRAAREHGDFDAVLTDINMPIMDGLTLLRELDTLNSDMKAVVVSAYGDMDNIRAAMQLGAIDFITKPIDLNELVGSIKKTLAVTQRLKQARLSELQKVQAEAASEAKSRFLADISHELRTPLNVILLYSDLMVKEMGEHEGAEDARAIQTAARHLMKLIADLQDFSRLEAGKLTLQDETFSVSSVIGEVVAALREAVAEQGNRLEATGADVGTMRADATRVRQCLLNLLSNACKFSRGGAITLDTTRFERAGEDFVRFRVVDTGIGMSPEQASRIFERFEQADASISRDYGGTGLGLAITAQLCALMGGGIRVESTPGEGSVFTIELPLGAAPEPAADSLSTAPA